MQTMIDTVRSNFRLRIGQVCGVGRPRGRSALRSFSLRLRAAGRLPMLGRQYFPNSAPYLIIALVLLCMKTQQKDLMYRLFRQTVWYKYVQLIMPASRNRKVGAGDYLGLPEISVACFTLTCLAHQLI